VSCLELALLGSFRATLDGELARGLHAAQLRAILSYLAVESRREHTRESLASFFWPERPDVEALTALRHALSNLRSAIGDQQSP
jgi:DNA-binding SARP family transcriptional activator